MEASRKPIVGFVGLGAMGFGMATNLVKKGYTIKGYDIWAPTLERFKAAGGEAAFSLADSAKDCLHYVCVVATAAQAQSALFANEDSVVKALPKDATLILCSTVPADFVQSVQRQLKDAGRDDIYFIDAPMSGGAIRAAAGTLSIMASGPGVAIKKARPLLADMADPQKLYVVSGGIGAGSNLKMVHQVLCAIHILSAAEAQGFAARLGLDAKQVGDVLVSSDGWNWEHEHRYDRMIAEDYFPVACAVTITLKDISIVTASARLRDFPTPLSSTTEQAFLSGLAQGFGAGDDSMLVQLYYLDPIVKVQPRTTSAEDAAASMKLVISLMRYIHLCAAAEAIALAHHLNVDLALFYELASGSAAASSMFQLRGEEMISLLQTEKEQSLEQEPQAQHTRTLNEAVQEMCKVVQAAREVDCPLHLGGDALNLLLASKRRGFGEMSDSNVIRFW